MSIAATSLSASSGLQAMSGASYQMPASAKMTSLFDNIDTGGSGSISASQFAQAFQAFSPPKDFQAMGPDAIWSQLDPSNSGSVNKQDFVAGMTAMMRQMRGDASAPSPQAATTPAQTVSASDSILQSAMLGSLVNTVA